MSELGGQTGRRARGASHDAERVGPVLRDLPSVGSYFGLRDYGTGEWEGGDPDCDHAHAPARTIGNAPSNRSTLTTNNGQGPKPGDKFHADQRREVATVCTCGAIRQDQQLGLEPAPDVYVTRLVEVFAEVRRVLRNDGTLWLNVGDSYSAVGGNNQTPGRTARVGSTQSGTQQRSRRFDSKAKDLLGIPWMLAFALRADGWYLRSDVIWAKPNPMPESVTDRPTSAHEHVFLLTKRPTYFYDADAIREDSSPDMQRRALLGHTRGPGLRDASRGDATALVGGAAVDGAGRNKRNVWEIATQPYPEAHFATFPTKLVEPCVLAGSAKNDLVLDPFAGSGTVGVVCCWHGREFVGIELNPCYCDMARQRIEVEGRSGRRAYHPEPAPDQLTLL